MENFLIKLEECYKEAEKLHNKFYFAQAYKEHERRMEIIALARILYQSIIQIK